MKKTKILTLLSCGVLANSFASSIAAEPTNLVTNPGFESGWTSWTSSGQSSIVTKPYAGSYAMRTGTGIGGVVQNVTTKVAAGKTYTLSFFARLEALSVSSAIGIRFKNSNGVCWNGYGNTF